MRPLPGADATQLFQYHMNLLEADPKNNELHEIISTPLFTMPVIEYAQGLLDENGGEPFPQYGLLAGASEALENMSGWENEQPPPDRDPRIFFNVAAPSSTFICGSQGSGKSHTLSCLLESCLISSKASKLHAPLTGLVFHYDAFISDDGGSPCEAAFLSSASSIKVRVLCSPTNTRTIERTYHSLNVTVEPLRIDQTDLNTKRMLDMMAVAHDDGPVPLYLHTISRILRDMRTQQQETGGSFEYSEFKKRVLDANLSSAQLGPLNQRLDTLESFMSAPYEYGIKKKGKKPSHRRGTAWTAESGCLTIIDLSCPCVTPESACSLFNICLSIFLEQRTSVGRVIALDEAHKFMNTSYEALAFTNTLISTIRLQRHLGARIIISTQEPTISPALLDLSSATVVHRFTSPEWLQSLRGHLAAAEPNLLLSEPEKADYDRGRDAGHRKTQTQKIFSEIVKLNVGQALLFAPSAAMGIDIKHDSAIGLQRLGATYIKIKVRARLTADGGKSVMAS